MAPRRDGCAHSVCYGLNAAEELQDLKPKTFKEAFEGKESKE